MIFVSYTLKVNARKLSLGGLCRFADFETSYRNNLISSQGNSSREVK